MRNLILLIGLVILAASVHAESDAVLAIDEELASSISFRLQFEDVVIQSEKTIEIASDITWSNSHTLQIISQNNIVVKEGVALTGHGDLYLKSGIEDKTGKGTVIFQEGAYVDVKDAAKVSIYYNPEKYTPHKYHNPNPYFLHVKPSLAGRFYMLVNNARDLASIVFCMSGNYALSQDIDMRETKYWPRAFEPIYYKEEDVNFYGNFDGNGFAINDLTIVQPEQNDVGLFRKIVGYSHESHSEIKNLVFNNANIHGHTRVSALAANIVYTSLANIVLNNVTVTGQVGLGGLVGVSVFSKLENIHEHNTSLNTSAECWGKLVGASFESVVPEEDGLIGRIDFLDKQGGD